MTKDVEFVEKKEELAKTLMKTHFEDFKKTDIHSKGMPDSYKNSEGNKIILDCKKDRFEYHGKIPEDDLQAFRDSYEYEMKKKLEVVKTYFIEKVN